jgi:hypothetical protein
MVEDERSWLTQPHAGLTNLSHLASTKFACFKIRFWGTILERRFYAKALWRSEAIGYCTIFIATLRWPRRATA